VPIVSFSHAADTWTSCSCVRDDVLRVAHAYSPPARCANPYFPAPDLVLQASQAGRSVPRHGDGVSFTLRTCAVAASSALTASGPDVIDAPHGDAQLALQEDASTATSGSTRTRRSPTAADARDQTRCRSRDGWAVQYVLTCRATLRRTAWVACSARRSS
jgi:hypothetical protein